MGDTIKGADLDYSNYFWQGDKVRLRPLRVEDAEQFYVNTLDSPARRFLQLRMELPTTAELLRASVEKHAGVLTGWKRASWPVESEPATRSSSLWP